LCGTLSVGYPNMRDREHDKLRSTMGLNKKRSEEEILAPLGASTSNRALELSLDADFDYAAQWIGAGVIVVVLTVSK
jgi:hypothetical protein